MAKIGKNTHLSSILFACVVFGPACGDDSRGDTDGLGSSSGITSAGSTTPSASSDTDPSPTTGGGSTSTSGGSASSNGTTEDSLGTSTASSSSSSGEVTTTNSTSEGSSTGEGSTSTESSTSSSTSTGVEPPPKLEQVDVVITSDNAYKFCYGNENGVDTCYGDVHATTACQIFCCNGGPEVYEVEGQVAENSEYLYIVAWSDDSVTYGVIGYFQAMFEGQMAGDIIFTGTEDWEVCATGVDYDQEAGPSDGTISQKIAACNQPGHPKGGWLGTTPTVDGMIALGEDNSSNGGDFPFVCNNLDWDTYIPPEAAWMGINPWPNGVVPPGKSPFNSSDVGTGNLEFLIFRLETNTVITIE